MANTKISSLPTFTADTTGVYVVINNSGNTETFKVEIETLLSGLTSISTLAPITSTGDITGKVLVSTNAIGNEGGEINLTKSPNSTLSGNTIIDQFIDRLRIFEGAGSARGVYVDLSKAPNGVGGELLWKTSGIVDAGSFVTLDNLKATVSSSGDRALSIAAVSTTFSANISATYGGVGGPGGASSNNLSITTTPTLSLFSWNFVAEGEGATYLIYDKTNSRMYRVTMMIGPAYLNNFISIERLY